MGADSTDDDKAQNSGSPESVKPMDSGGLDAKGEAAKETFGKSVFVNSEPMREEQVQNAVKFLSHPKVRDSPVIYRRSFLEKKGLTKEEIDEAFRRVPDPPPNVTSAPAVTSSQDGQLKPSMSPQPQAPIQTPQLATAPNSGVLAVPTLNQSRFHWSHAIYAVGFLAASGAGTAVLLKNVVVPRFKSWIRKVVKEEDDSEKKDNSKPTLAEEATAAAKAAAAAAADVAKASQEMLNSKNEERKYFEAFKSVLDVQVEEMKLMGNTIRKLEATREVTPSVTKHIEEHVQSASGNGPIDSTWRTFSSDQQVKVNGTADVDFGSVRPSSAPASMEPAVAPHPKSYMEIMAMVQRGEKPPGIKEINDKPPNPNQAPSNPRLAPRIKPWEVGQGQHSSNYGLQSEVRDQGSSFEVQDNGTSNGTEPWWRHKTVKITEIEEERDNPRTTSNGMRTIERPVQRGWVPPQPPPIAMAEAAAAIRQPKSSIQKEKSGDEQLTTHSDDGIDEMQRITRVSEPEIEIESSSGVVDRNPPEIQEEQDSIVEVN
ncbi:peroxisomal membrane protein PEX14-like isoform X2 [Tasmannia lanceolata]|uniref:peroxisomal membrane protein PEX14-like isoform X2 n=1 Tax=Tasmannia lanceolata TaxID=3420 RepID=UPI004062B1D9